MRRGRQENIQISWRTASRPCLALTRQPNARSVFNARGNIDRERPLLGHAALAIALAARIRDRLAPATALRTGTLNGEKSLRCPHAAGTIAHAAGGRCRARLCAAAGA